jgi:hypothetical protein
MTFPVVYGTLIMMKCTRHRKCLLSALLLLGLIAAYAILYFYYRSGGEISSPVVEPNSGGNAYLFYMHHL